MSSPKALISGALIEISFALPGAEPVSFKALVRHSSEDRGCGVEFVEVLPHHQARLSSYLDRLDAAIRAVS